MPSLYRDGIPRYILEMDILQQIIHYSGHLLIPGLIAWLLFRKNWKSAWLIMLATMIIDLDHLLADPIFDSDRCGIEFHPLHSYYAIGVYAILLISPKTRIVGVGLVFHIIIDYLDCMWMEYL